jgi:hypothetical protein
MVAREGRALARRAEAALCVAADAVRVVEAAAPFMPGGERMLEMVAAPSPQRGLSGAPRRAAASAHGPCFHASNARESWIHVIRPVATSAIA